MTKTDDDFEKRLNEFIKNHSDGLTDVPSYLDVANWAKSHFESKLEEKDREIKELNVKIKELTKQPMSPMCMVRKELWKQVQDERIELKQKLEGYEKLMKEFNGYGKRCDLHKSKDNIGNMFRRLEKLLNKNERNGDD